MIKPMKLKLKKGALHASLGLPKSKPIATDMLKMTLQHTQDPKVRKQLQFALNARKWNKV